MLKRRIGAVSVVLGVVVATGAARAEDAASDTTRDPRAIGSLVWGIKGGLTMSTLSGDGTNPSASNAEPTLHQGIAIGGFNTWRFARGLSLQTEAYLASRGANFEDLAGEPIDESYLYVELPVMARYDLAIDDRFSVFGVAGPSLGYLIDSKARERDDLNLLDVSVTAGVGADLRAGGNLIVLDVRYSLGLMNTIDLDGGTGKNRVLSFLLGFTT